MLTFKYLRKIQMLNILFIIDIINFPYKHYCKNVATYLLFVNVLVTIELRANIETNRSNIKPSLFVCSITNWFQYLNLFQTRRSLIFKMNKNCPLYKAN